MKKNTKILIFLYVIEILSLIAFKIAGDAENAPLMIVSGVMVVIGSLYIIANTGALHE